MLTLLLPWLLQAPSTAPAPPPAAAPAYQHVLLISVDGLRADALDGATPLPAFARLERGPHTVNARTDPDFTVTLPNHTDMVTGRTVRGTGGHGWDQNDDPRPGSTLHDIGGYVASVFDVAHDHGLRTGVFVGKTKFSLFDLSWGSEHGAPDGAGEDNGRDKIDQYLCNEDSSKLTAAVIQFLARPGPALVFLHYRDCDAAGHASGWDVASGCDYMRAVAAVDHELGLLLDAVEGSEALSASTAVVLTADHGGGVPRTSHDHPDAPVDYTIPFLVWLGPGQAAADLYALNPETRKDPGGARRADAGPPVRNGDAANLLLSLLQLPAVPGSTINPGQELRFQAGPAPAR